MSGVEFYEQSYKISSVNCFIKMGAHGTIERLRDPLTGLATVSEMINWSTGCRPACLNERERVQWGWGIEGLGNGLWSEVPKSKIYALCLSLPCAVRNLLAEEKKGLKIFL